MGSHIEIIDACFGFVRKRNTYRSLNSPKHETKIFPDHDDVISQHSTEIKKSENVSRNFLAYVLDNYHQIISPSSSPKLYAINHTF